MARADRQGLMIRVRPRKEPKEFEMECRRPGNAWLAAHRTAQRPKAFWLKFVQDLAASFEQRCGYSAVIIQNGTVDHFQSWNNNRRLAYEWSNYRYADGRLNAKKQTADGAVLDPFEVHDDWFEIILPSLQLQLTNNVPERMRARAAYTLRRLGLDHDERIVTYRAQWYCQYHCCGLSLESMEQIAPLIAQAIKRAHMSPDPVLCGYGALARGAFAPKHPRPTRNRKPSRKPSR
jgi:hypothetical protein